MQNIKTTKSILNRVSDLDKKTQIFTKPNIIIIEQDKKQWLIKEYYFNNQIDYKELFYKDYTKYLESKNLDTQTPIIIDDLVSNA